MSSCTAFLLGSCPPFASLCWSEICAVRLFACLFCVRRMSCSSWTTVLRSIEQAAHDPDASQTEITPREQDAEQHHHHHHSIFTGKESTRSTTLRPFARSSPGGTGDATLTGPALPLAAGGTTAAGEREDLENAGIASSPAAKRAVAAASAGVGRESPRRLQLSRAPLQPRTNAIGNSSSSSVVAA